MDGALLVQSVHVIGANADLVGQVAVAAPGRRRESHLWWTVRSIRNPKPHTTRLLIPCLLGRCISWPHCATVILISDVGGVSNFERGGPLVLNSILLILLLHASTYESRAYMLRLGSQCALSSMSIGWLLPLSMCIAL